MKDGYMHRQIHDLLQKDYIRKVPVILHYSFQRACL